MNSQLFRQLHCYKARGVYLEYHSVCPLVGIGTRPPPPLGEASVQPPPPPWIKGGDTLARGWGGGGIPIRTTGEKA